MARSLSVSNATPGRGLGARRRPLHKSPYPWVVLGVWLVPLLAVVIVTEFFPRNPDSCLMGPDCASSPADDFALVALWLYVPLCVFLTAGACEVTYWTLRVRSSRRALASSGG